MADPAVQAPGGATNIQSPAERRVASWAGWLMAITFFTSIPASLILYDDVLNHTDFILGSGNQTRVEVGAFLEVALSDRTDRRGGGHVPDPAAKA